MSFHATPDPNVEPIRFGQRMQILRQRRGMTREVLGGLLGMSTSWVKRLENGQLNVPAFDTVLAIAEALRVRDLFELTGGRSIDVGMFVGPGHARLPAVAAAINALPLTTDRQAPPAAHLQARLTQAWESRHRSKNHREVIATLLPDLIRLTARAAVRRTGNNAGQRGCGAPPRVPCGVLPGCRCDRSRGDHCGVLAAVKAEDQTAKINKKKRPATAGAERF